VLFCNWLNRCSCEINYYLVPDLTMVIVNAPSSRPCVGSRNLLFLLVAIGQDSGKAVATNSDMAHASLLRICALHVQVFSQKRVGEKKRAADGSFETLPTGPVDMAT
jgi:hypothetical protein